MKKESATGKFVISMDASIEDALKVITHNRRGAVVVVDEKKKVMGVASDGDIRRAFVRGISMFAPITKAMNPHCVYIKKGSAEDKKPEAYLKKHPNITLLPVVTSNFVLTHLYQSAD